MKILWLKICANVILIWTQNLIHSYWKIDQEGFTMKIWWIPCLTLVRDSLYLVFFVFEGLLIWVLWDCKSWIQNCFDGLEFLKFVEVLELDCIRMLRRVKMIWMSVLWIFSVFEYLGVKVLLDFKAWIQ